MPWTEKYRPRKVEEILGQENVVDRLGAYIQNRNLPHLLFAGPAGVGKTTAAIAIAHELYGKNYQESFLELNASDERGIDIVRGKIKNFARSVPLEKVQFKIIFLDEADALTADAQNALRRTMEMYSNATRFILSCNYSSKIIEPIQSRCAMFRFTRLEKRDVEKMIHRIAKKENLDISKDAVEALVEIGEGDMRKVINLLQSAALNAKKITEKQIYSLSSRAKPKEIDEVIMKAYNGEFSEARKTLQKLMVNYGMSGQDVLDQVYKSVVRMSINDEQKVRIVDRIGEYNFRLSEGADERIQVAALLAQISLEGKKDNGGIG